MDDCMTDAPLSKPSDTVPTYSNKHIQRCDTKEDLHRYHRQGRWLLPLRVGCRNSIRYPMLLSLFVRSRPFFLCQ